MERQNMELVFSASHGAFDGAAVQAVLVSAGDGARARGMIRGGLGLDTVLGGWVL
jgi:hypothetical protein